MLRTNLASRPFYNERAVHLALAAAAALMLGATVFNVTEIVALSGHQTALKAGVDRDEAQARRLAEETARLRGSIRSQDLETLSVAAREVNAIIDRRTFSWTEIFNRFEATLPPDVMIASVRPKIEKDEVVTVSMIVIGRRADDIDTFMEKLEQTGAFVDLLWREESVNEDELLEATIEGRYRPSPTRSTVTRGTAGPVPAGGLPR